MTTYALLLIMLLPACGDNGNNDTILTGFSGVLIFGIVVWIIYRYATRRK